MAEQREDVTRLLVDWSEGDRDALEELLPIVDVELRRIASSFMRRERAGHTLQTSALINEAYLKLIDQNRTQWQNRSHFFAMCAKLMRRILCDHARRRKAKKRGEGNLVTLPEVLPDGSAPGFDLLDLDNALQRLEATEARLAQVVEMRYYADLTIEELAEVTGRSTASCKRDLARAKGLLRGYLAENG